MGIFASRNIQHNEELTFNYNVDRYGHVVLHLRVGRVLIVIVIFHRHEAQSCYCGEPKCIGFIGGKTQTDIGAMDDLYLDGNVFFGPSSLLLHLIMSISKHLESRMKSRR